MVIRRCRSEQIKLNESAVCLALTEVEARKAELRQIRATEREVEAEARQAADSDPHRRRRGTMEAAYSTGLDERDVRRTKRHVSETNCIVLHL